jgi:beta-ribofuranosylaminobenzene 5'-phosphate synthase
MISMLRQLEESFPLSSVEKILLTTDGSVTRILEALVGEEVMVVTEMQEVISANKELASELDIREGAKVNHRVVDLRSSTATLAHAISYAPLERLGEDFKEDIMKKDIPIGRIMSSLNMESRREIQEIGTFRGDEELCGKFNLPTGSLFLNRRYHVVHMGEVLISITEIFPKGVY